jgi:hypothetical protein
MMSLAVLNDRILRIDDTILRSLLSLAHPVAKIKLQGNAAGKHQRQDDKQPDEQDGQKGSRGASQNNEPRETVPESVRAGLDG